jgi:hypothetical protein
VPQRKLPVSNGQPASGGFVTFPQGTFTADPASAVKADNVYGLSFDRAVAKWVPVPRSWVSPDGARYAYWEWQTRSMQAVAIAAGAESTLGPKPNGAASAARLNTDAGWTPIEALDSGIYAVPSGGYQSNSPGLYMFPWSGAGERQVSGSGFWHAIGGGKLGARSRSQCRKGRRTESSASISAAAHRSVVLSARPPEPGCRL